jgi:hypothetical protein
MHFQQFFREGVVTQVDRIQELDMMISESKKNHENRALED